MACMKELLELAEERETLLIRLAEMAAILRGARAAGAAVPVVCLLDCTARHWIRSETLDRCTSCGTPVLSADQWHRMVVGALRASVATPVVPAPARGNAGGMSAPVMRWCTLVALYRGQFPAGQVCPTCRNGCADGERWQARSAYAPSLLLRTREGAAVPMRSSASYPALCEKGEGARKRFLRHQRSVRTEQGAARR
jgi:hypothetical protein